MHLCLYRMSLEVDGKSVFLSYLWRSDRIFSSLFFAIKCFHPIKMRRHKISMESIVNGNAVKIRFQPICDIFVACNCVHGEID